MTRRKCVICGRPVKKPTRKGGRPAKLCAEQACAKENDRRRARELRQARQEKPTPFRSREKMLAAIRAAGGDVDRMTPLLGIGRAAVERLLVHHALSRILSKARRGAGEIVAYPGERDGGLHESGVRIRRVPQGVSAHDLGKEGAFDVYQDLENDGITPSKPPPARLDPTP